MKLQEALAIFKKSKWIVDDLGKASFGVFDAKAFVIYEVILLMKSEHLLIQRYDLTRFKKEKVYKQKVDPGLLLKLSHKGHSLFVKQVLREHHD